MDATPTGNGPQTGTVVHFTNASDDATLQPAAASAPTGPEMSDAGTQAVALALVQALYGQLIAGLSTGTPTLAFGNGQLAVNGNANPFVNFIAAVPAVVPSVAAGDGMGATNATVGFRPLEPLVVPEAKKSKRARTVVAANDDEGEYVPTAEGRSWSKAKKKRAAPALGGGDEAGLRALALAAREEILTTSTYHHVFPRARGTAIKYQCLMRIEATTKYLGTFSTDLAAARIADRANIWRIMHERGEKSGPARGPLNFPQSEYAADFNLIRGLTCEQLVGACRAASLDETQPFGRASETA